MVGIVKHENSIEKVLDGFASKIPSKGLSKLCLRKECSFDMLHILTCSLESKFQLSFTPYDFLVADKRRQELMQTQLKRNLGEGSH